jgi:uncharacterized membrane protein
MRLHGLTALFTLIGISAVGLVLYFLGRVLFKLLRNAESTGKLDSILGWLKGKTFKALVVIVPIYFAFIALWFCFKVFFSFLMWLKHGYWQFYDYQPACQSLEFSCFPNTGFVKINELLLWVYNFDITIFLIVAGILIVILGFLLVESSKSEKTS